MRALLAILVILVFSGCGAVGLPRPLTSSDVASLRNAASPLVLAIAPEGNDDIAEELIAILRENRTFSEVGFVSELGSRADVVGRLEYEHTPVGAVIPVFSIFSLGVIPSFFHERQRVSLHFDGLPRRVIIEAQANAPVVMGWFGLLLRASPGWALVKEPRDLSGNTRRVAEHLAVALAARSDEIRSLAARVPRR